MVTLTGMSLSVCDVVELLPAVAVGTSKDVAVLDGGPTDSVDESVTVFVCVD